MRQMMKTPSLPVWEAFNSSRASIHSFNSAPCEMMPTMRRGLLKVLEGPDREIERLRIQRPEAFIAASVPASLL